MRELADAIIAFLAARNDNPQRYIWKAKGATVHGSTSNSLEIRNVVRLGRDRIAASSPPPPAHSAECESASKWGVFLLYQKGRDSRIFQAQYH